MRALIAILTTLRRGVRGVVTEMVAVTALFAIGVVIALIVTAIF